MTLLTTTLVFAKRNTLPVSPSLSASKSQIPLRYPGRKSGRRPVASCNFGLSRTI